MTTPASATPLPGPLAASGVTFRPYRGLDDIPDMGAANARLRARAGVLEPIDEAAMRHRYSTLVNSDPLVDCIVAERAGRVVGYARTEWHDLVDGDRLYDITSVVEPDAWGLGVSEAFVAWAEEHVRETARAHPSDRRSWIGHYTFGGDEDLTRALTGSGYEAVRWDAEMERPDLEDIPDVALAEGYSIHPPTPDQLPAVFDMMVVAFAEHWGESEAQEQSFDKWVTDPRFRLDLIVVAWHGDVPAAVVSNIVETQPDGRRSGLLDSVCTHPDHRRLGLARATIIESLRRLRVDGATSAYLGVDTDNHNRASALYESCGFRAVSGGTSYRKAYADHGAGDRVSH